MHFLKFIKKIDSIKTFEITSASQVEKINLKLREARKCEGSERFGFKVLGLNEQGPSRTQCGIRESETNQ